MVGLDPEEFTILPAIEGNQTLSIPGDLLKTTQEYDQTNVG